MTQLRIGALLALAAFTLGCVGQSQPEKARYRFEVTPDRILDPGDQGSVQINRVKVAPAFERKVLVYRLSEDEYRSDFYHEFYSTPSEFFHDGMERWFDSSGLFTRVLPSSARSAADWWIEGQVDELYADVRDRARPEAVLSAELSLVDPKTPDLRLVFSKRYRSVVALDDPKPATVVNGIRLAARQILVSFDADLRQVLEGRARDGASAQPGPTSADTAPAAPPADPR